MNNEMIFWVVLLTTELKLFSRKTPTSVYHVRSKLQTFKIHGHFVFVFVYLDCRLFVTKKSYNTIFKMCIIIFVKYTRISHSMALDSSSPLPEMCFSCLYELRKNMEYTVCTYKGLKSVSNVTLSTFYQ